MRYSEILGPVYHKIGLSPSCQFWIDVHFTAAAHHLIRYREALSGSHEEKFHDELFRAHFRRMKEIVYTGGDFTRAVDPTHMCLHRRATWNPKFDDIIDPLMFNKMKPDGRFAVGIEHISDPYL